MNRKETILEAKELKNRLAAKYALLKKKILKEGAYICGTGKLGDFASNIVHKKTNLY